MIHTTALLVLLFASGNFAQAPDNTTVAPNLDVNDALLDGPGPDGNDALPYGCDPANTAMEKCDLQYNCSASCEEAFQVATDPGEEMGDPLAGMNDPTNTSGISAALRAGFDSACGSSKEQICVAKECCPECVDELEAALQCNVDEVILSLNNTLASFLDNLGGAVDAGLGLLNDLVGSTLNTTIASTGSAQGGDDSFADFFASLTCEIKDNPCDSLPATSGESATPGVTPAPGETPAPGGTPGPGGTPAPGVTPAPGGTPAPGSTTTPGPSPASSAIMAYRMYTAVAMAAALGIILM